MRHFLQSYSCPPSSSGRGISFGDSCNNCCGNSRLDYRYADTKKQQQAIEATKRTETANGNAKQSTITFHVYIYTCTCILKTCQLSA